MNAWHRLAAAGLLALAPWSGLAADADPYNIPAQQVEAFARQLQAALRQRDLPAVAALTAEPLRVNAPGRKPQQLTRAALLKQFDAVFTPPVVAQVLQQDPASLFQNYQGVMFGDGAVWAQQVCPGTRRPDCPLRIIAVNLAAVGSPR